MAKVKSQKTWLLTADGKAVPEGSLDAASLLVHAGCEIDTAELARYGLTPDGYALLRADDRKAAMPTEPENLSVEIGRGNKWEGPAPTDDEAPAPVETPKKPAKRK